ncbi:putative formyltransferase [Lyophyllum shimeji]|uniref:methionyl-tRNA formyltransferase n=1 Tax=Lyophyllum shimeji TaxID=47721 RepID=A0A9P3UTE9_LYOSH|nr:putative formyltransferase [Lyophyllum shimeji]
MGRDEFSCLVFRELHAARDVWDDIVIATNPDEKTGRRGSHLSVSPLKLLGESLKVPVHTIPHTKPEFKHWKLPEPFSNAGNPPSMNHVVVTASFGRILPPSMLDMFAPTRRLNLHPSLLPAYRGPAPIQRAILNGEKETGVSVIEMLKWKQGIDAGAIWGTSRVPLHDGAMFPELRDTLAYVGGRLLVSVLRDMRVGKAESKPQPPVDSLPRAPSITAADSAVNFSTMSAESIVRRHRAISHQRPLITCLSSEKTVQLHSPYVLNTPPDSLSTVPGTSTFQKSTRTLVIRCADGSVLSVPLMKQEGKALMEAKDWWNGAKGLGLVHDGELKFLDEFNHLL